MKRINILTYCCWTSFGSILQSFALSNTLTKLGYENRIWLEEWNRVIIRHTPKNIKDLLKQVYTSPKNLKIHHTHPKRQEFILRHMDVEYFPDYESFGKKAGENKDDVYLAGSDQIWNPDRNNPLFFLEFVKNSKKISYAASMGNTNLDPEKEEQFKKRLNSFDRISVRERVCKDALQKLTEKEIEVHIDPTFLLEADEWRALEKQYRVKGPYILLYMLYWDNSLKNKIAELRRRTGLPVYAVCPYASRVYADRCLYDVGVEEFLWLIDHAEYVVTSSFHGVAFSILFNKRFAAVVNSTMPSRIQNLLDVLSLPRVGIDELGLTDEFSYDRVVEKIEKERERGIEYLKEAIG